MALYPLPNDVLPILPDPPFAGGFTRIVERYFRRNEGTTDYATIPEITLTGDFVIEFDLMVSDSGSFHQILSGEDCTLNVRGDSTLVLFTGGVISATSTGTVVRGAFNSIKLSLSDGQYTFVINGLSETVASTVNNLAIGRLYDRTNIGTSSPLQGILANLKIWDNGTLIRDYSLDDNSDTLIDRVSGQNGTVINGNASDWGLFQQQATGEWLGQELVDISTFTPTAEWEVDGGTVSKVGDTTSNFDIAQVQSGRSYLTSVFKEAGNTGSPNLRVGGTQVLFPWLVQGTPAGTYPFTISTPISGVLAFNGTGSRFVVSQISVKEVLNVA